MKLYVIGIGPGDPELVTVKAKKIIENCRLIFVPSMKAIFPVEPISPLFLYFKIYFHGSIVFPYFSDPDWKKP